MKHEIQELYTSMSRNDNLIINALGSDYKNYLKSQSADRIAELQYIINLNQLFGEKAREEAKAKWEEAKEKAKWEREHNWADKWVTSYEEDKEYRDWEEQHRDLKLRPNMLTDMTGEIVRQTPGASGNLFLLYSGGLGTGTPAAPPSSGGVQGWEQFRAKAAEIQRESAARYGSNPDYPVLNMAQSGSGKVGPGNLRAAGLEGVDLAKASYNAGRKQLENAGFVLSEETSTGRKIFTHPVTNARVTYDSGKALGAGQKPHWTIQDATGQYLDRSGRPVTGPNPPMGGKHIPGQ